MMKTNLALLLSILLMAEPAVAAGPLIWGESGPTSIQSGGITLKDGHTLENDGETNYIRTGKFEVSGVGDWTTFDDGAVTAPVDGDGGTPSALSIARTTTTPLAPGDGSLLITKTAADAQGEGLVVPFTIANGFPNRMHYFSAVSEFSSGYSNGDMGAWIRCDLDGTPATYKLSIAEDPNGTLDGNSLNKTTQIYGTFVSPATSTLFDCQLELMVVTTGTTAWTLEIDNVEIGPGSRAVGAVVGSVTAFTPEWTNDTGITWDITTATWQQIGDSMLLNMTAQVASGTGSDSSCLKFSVPGGYTADTSNSFYSGGTLWYSASTTTGESMPLLGGLRPQDSGTTLGIAREDLDTGSNDGCRIGSVFGTHGTTNKYYGFSISAVIPIVEWAGKGTTNVAVNDIIYQSAWTSYKGLPTTSVGHTDYTLLKFQTHAYGTASYYSSSTGVFTSPFTGRLRVSAMAGLTAQVGDGKELVMVVKKNNQDATSTGYVALGPSGMDQKNVGIDTTIEVAQGDEISLHIYQNSGGSMSTATDDGNRVEFVRVADITADASVSFGLATADEPGLVVESDWIDVSDQFSSTPTGWSVTAAKAKVEQDTAGQWSVTLAMEASVTSASGTVSATFDGVTPSFNQALVCYPNSTTMNAKITTAGVISTAVTSGSRTGFMVSGTFLVDSKPTWVP